MRCGSARWSKDLLVAALSRSDTPLGLTVKDGRTQDLVGSGELQKLVEKPEAYVIEYRDGLRATMLNLRGALQDFNFAARVTRAGDRVDAVSIDAGSERDLLGVSDE